MSGKNSNQLFELRLLYRLKKFWFNLGRFPFRMQFLTSGHLARIEFTRLYPIHCNYSDRKLFTGFNVAAFIARKLTVSKVIISEPMHEMANIHHGIVVR